MMTHSIITTRHRWLLEPNFTPGAGVENNRHHRQTESREFLGMKHRP